MADTFKPDAAARRVIPRTVSPTVDDLTRVATDASPVRVFRQSAGQVAELFDDERRIGHVGRNSIPKSHRGEGRNYVD